MEDAPNGRDDDDDADDSRRLRPPPSADVASFVGAAAASRAVKDEDDDGVGVGGGGGDRVRVGDDAGTTNHHLAESRRKGGRFKKLWKRFLNAPSVSYPKKGSGWTSGITSRDDCSELKALRDDNSGAAVSPPPPPLSSSSPPSEEVPPRRLPSPVLWIGPSVVLQSSRRRGRSRPDEPASWQKCDGDDHRDLLLNLLYRREDGSGDRRPNRKVDRYDDALFAPPSLPSWAILCNPGCAEGVAVIEFSIVRGKNRGKKKMNGSDSRRRRGLVPSSVVSTSSAAPSSNGDGKGGAGMGEERRATSVVRELLSEQGCLGRRALPVVTRLFQGDSPKSLSDVLMYFDDRRLRRNRRDRRPGAPSSVVATDAGSRKRKREQDDEAEGEETKPSSSSRWRGALKKLTLTKERLEREGYPLLARWKLTRKLVACDGSRRNAGALDSEYTLADSNGENDDDDDGRRSALDWLRDAVKRRRNGSFRRRGSVEAATAAMAATGTTTTATDTASTLPFDEKTSASIVERLGVPEIDSPDEDDNKSEDAEGSTSSSSSPSVREWYVPTCLSRDDLSSSGNDADGEGPRVFAMDCEMVRTSKGLELARVTIVRATLGEGRTGKLHDTAASSSSDVAAVANDGDDREQGEDVDEEGEGEGYEVVLDAFVRPRRKVLDYLTAYSGVTAELLERSTTVRIEQVQAAILAVIGKDDVVVGHSLENDLRAVRMVHENVVDTAVLFKGKDGRKHALRHLSAVLLKRRIQSGTSTAVVDGANGVKSSAGHCSEEDAVASLVLALRRARFGDSFRLRDDGRRGNDGKTNLLDAVCETRRRESSTSCNGDGDSSSSSRCSCMAGRSTGKIVVVGGTEWIKTHVTSGKNNAHALTCESIGSANAVVDAIPAWLGDGKRRASLLWANLVVEEECNDDDDDGVDPWERIDDLMRKILERASEGIALLFVFQRGFDEAMSLTRRRKACRDVRSVVGWTKAQENDWREAVEDCRNCEALWVGATN